MVESTLPLWAPGKDVVTALLMLDLKRWGVRMKSIWLWTCPLGACLVAVLENLLGWRVLARVSRWLLANSRSLHPLSFVSPMPNLPTIPAQCLCASGPTLPFQSPWTTGISFRYWLQNSLSQNINMANIRISKWYLKRNWKWEAKNTSKHRGERETEREREREIDLSSLV